MDLEGEGSNPFAHPRFRAVADRLATPRAAKNAFQAETPGFAQIGRLFGKPSPQNCRRAPQFSPKVHSSFRRLNGHSASACEREGLKISLCFRLHIPLLADALGRGKDIILQFGVRPPVAVSSSSTYIASEQGAKLCANPRKKTAPATEVVIPTTPMTGTIKAVAVE